MPNHLADETSPYLLQHVNNPVDWHPWGPEALALSKKENKPIFLSIGYSACHWCHVMEHESFENEAIAKSLNEKFICIKVDREERPDLDQLYMNAVQMMTGRGGWPMSVFLTPELKPFYSGTYWPPKRSRGMPGFDEVIVGVSNAWETNREAVVETAGKMTEELAKIGLQEVPGGALSRDLISDAVGQFRQSFDSTHGGFGGAPKFPAPMGLQLLLRQWHRKQDRQALNMVKVTLDRMAAGGIYDHLGGGFARYSVDAHWLVPHFEKMLYDNAQLAATYIEAYQATGDEDYARVVRETLDYMLRDMTDDLGGFYSTEDADSEGVEGKFYVWTPAQLREVLGEEAAKTFATVYDVTDAGNFEHANILNLPKSIAQQAQALGRGVKDLEKELSESRAKLFAAREPRVHPGKDDKVIVAWNGLMIDAMARAGAVLGDQRYLDAAVKAADFILTLRRKDRRLLHTWRHGQAKLDAYLDDYANLANGLISLYEATFDGRHLDSAIELMQMVLDHFSDSKAGGFYYTADDHEELIVRNKDFTDNAVPSGNAMAATALIRLGKLTGKQTYTDAAEATMLASLSLMQRAPSAVAQMLLAVDLQLGPTYEMVLAGNLQDAGTTSVLADLRRRFLPNKVLAFAAEGAQPPTALADLLQGKSMLDGSPTLYVCEGFTCQAPVQGDEEIAHTLDELMPKGMFE